MRDVGVFLEIMLRLGFLPRYLQAFEVTTLYYSLCLPEYFSGLFSLPLIYSFEISFTDRSYQPSQCGGREVHWRNYSRFAL